MGIISHYLIEDHRLNADQYYAAIQSLGGQPTITNAMVVFRAALTGPLHPCAHCTPAFQQRADQHRARIATIEAYRPHRLHPEIYTGDWPKRWFAPQIADAIFGKEEADVDTEAAPGGAEAASRTIATAGATAGAAAEGGRASAGGASQPPWSSPSKSSAASTLSSSVPPPPPSSPSKPSSPTASSPASLQAALRQESEGVYSFPLFTDEFCAMLLEELDHFLEVAAARDDLVIRRPNSMNNYGVIINEIGLEHAIDTLQVLVMQPVAALLFPVEGGRFDGHHSFLVQYEAAPDRDTHLDMHTDDSDVTFNVCLGKVFEGAGLTFCGIIGTPGHRLHAMQFMHELGRCVVHLGNQRHGADVITEGERANLILWNHNADYRASTLYARHNRGDYAQESGPPDAVCLSYTHDRDYGVFQEYARETSKHRGTGWCPLPKGEYAGFIQEDKPVHSV